MNGTANPNDSDGIWVIGAGGHAKVVIETIWAAGETVAGVFDSDPKKNGSNVLGASVTAPFSNETLAQLNARRAVIAIGSNQARKRLAEELSGIEWVTIIHPFSYVSPSARVANGSVVFAGAVIQANANIGAHTIINTSSSVDHDCIIGDWSHVAPGAHLAGGVRLGEGVLAGVGCQVLPKITAGSWSVIGGGALVNTDIPERAVATGVPIRLTRQSDPKK